MRISFLIQNKITYQNSSFKQAFGQRCRQKEAAFSGENNLSFCYNPAYFTYKAASDIDKVYDRSFKGAVDKNDIVLKSLEDKLIHGEGGEAYVFDILGADDYVLRVPKARYLRIADGDLKTSEIVPVLHDEKLFNNRNLGLPLYVVRDAGAFRETPCFLADVGNETDPVTILRKVPGDTLMYSYKDALKKLVGIDKYYDSVREEQFGLFLSALRNPKNMQDSFTGCGKLMENEDFAKDYRDFADKYLTRLEEIANMPKEAYDKALKVIREADGFILDFKNPDNILLDIDKQEFNFVDLQFNPAVSSYYECDDVKRAFRDVLLGGNQFYIYTFDYPGELLADASDFDRFLRLKTTIDKKCGLEDEFDFS